MDGRSLGDVVIDVFHSAWVHTWGPSTCFYFLKAQSSFKFASLSANLSHQHVWRWMLWARRHPFEPGLKDLIINTDLALEQSGCGADSGAAHEVGGGKDSFFFLLQVWWYASLKMTTCKNCLEDPIKYVWNYIFKGRIDREIHHPIVKCRNTISAWILSNTRHWKPHTVRQTGIGRKHDFNITCDFHTTLFFPSRVFGCINYKHRSLIWRSWLAAASPAAK